MNACFWAEQRAGLGAIMYEDADGEDRDEKILRRAMTFKSVQKSLRFGLKPEQASVKWTNSLPVSTHFRDAHKRKVAWDA